MSENESVSSRSPSKPSSETRKGRIVILVGLIGLFVLVFCMALKSRRMAEPEAVALWVPPAALKIGTVWETDHFEWVLPVENREATPIQVTSFSRSCSCLSVEPEAFTIEPGARRELRLTINLGSQLKPSGEVSIQLMPQLKVREGPIQGNKTPPVWEITGRVRRVLDCERQPYLGSHSELSEKLALKTPLKSLVPLKSISMECDLPGWGASFEQGKGGEWAVRVTPPAPLRVGRFQGIVSVKPVLKGGEQLPPQQIRFFGEIVPDVEAVPAAVRVGGRHLGETFEETVVLRSLTGHAFTTIRAEAEGSGLAAQPIVGGQCVLVRQVACMEGTQSNRVLLHVRSGGREVMIAVPVSYTGIDVR
jgi:hypothetical protein